MKDPVERYLKILLARPGESITIYADNRKRKDRVEVFKRICLSLDLMSIKYLASETTMKIKVWK